MLSTKEKCELRSTAHHLKPVVMIGANGLTQAVQLEIERALLDHELIKIRINLGDKSELKKIIEQICKAREAELIQTVGYVAVIYRKKDETD